MPLRYRSALRFAASVFACCALVSTASAQVTEPNGFPIPQPANPSEVGCCVTGRGFPESADELDGLFQYRQDPLLNSKTDAKTGPGVFSPLCGFTGTLVLRGGACKLDFGWYNVTASGAAPSDAEIYTLIPHDDPGVYGTGNVDFCPLAGVSTNPQENGKCTVTPFAANNIRSDPRYLGGLIGFAIRGSTSTSCPETHYSQNELHAKCTSCTPASPWIMSLLYESKAFPDSFYLAFEDQKAGDFGQGKSNDGDFNDFVFFISGVTCDGGGQPCDASIANPSLKGLCAAGRTGCSLNGDGTSVCNPVLTPSAEKCDNLDNDCDGVVDNGDNLCPTGQVCDRGTCVSACNTGEFACENGLVCNSAGFCVDPLCKDVTCNAGQVCRAGTCTGGCTGAVCPSGQECQLGRCVDLCKNVTCGDSQVCDRGVCISSCKCRPCLDGQACAADGRCVDVGCENKNCGAGMLCSAGNCVDACAGAVCPGGAACQSGECGDPLPGVTTPNAGSGGGITLPGNSGGSISINAGGSGNSTSPGAGAGGAARGAGSATGCGCRSARAPGGAGGAMLLALGLVLARRRRASKSSDRKRA